jgi:hypothetical protein
VRGDPITKGLRLSEDPETRKDSPSMSKSSQTDPTTVSG